MEVDAEEEGRRGGDERVSNSLQRSLEAEARGVEMEDVEAWKVGLLLVLLAEEVGREGTKEGEEIL